MAIQSAFYFTDGTTRTFPSTKHIASSANVAVWMKRVVDDVWELTSYELWTLVNNSIVFTVAPQSTVYSQIELRIADESDELIESPSNIALVAGSIANVDTVATNISAVNTVSTNITAVQHTSANATNINTVSTNIANVNTVATNIANVNTTASNIANVNAVASDLLEPISEINTVATDIANVNTVGLAITAVNTVATSIANVNSVATTIVPSIAEILLADDNAIIAATKANEASDSAAAALAYKNAIESYDYIVAYSRKDKYLAAQNVANMLYNIDGKLEKVRYNTDTDTNYEVLTYNIDGKLSNVSHYLAGTLAGNTVLTYSAGKLISAIYTGV